MKKLLLFMAMSGSMLLLGSKVSAQTLKDDGTYDPDCVVEKWSNSSTYDKIIDLNFSDEFWPNTWTTKWADATGTAKDCPSDSDGVYVNTIIDIPVNGSDELTYPMLFHKCCFANKNAYNGYGASTAAFARQNYLGENPAGNSATTYNNWTVAGHTEYIEDSIKYDSEGYAIYGQAGFVQMCRELDTSEVRAAKRRAGLGWVEIDHIPYVERIQWAWSSTSWGRGIKCDIKIGDADWTHLVWFGNDLHKQGYTVFSDQGYFIENVIDAEDVSLRWRVWDGDSIGNPVQSSSFAKVNVEHTWYQAPRLHKLQIFGNQITADEAQYAYDNPVSDVGDLSDMSVFDTEDEDDEDDTAPDANAPVVIYVVSQDGTGDYTDIQSAIDAVNDGERGIIYVRKGTYEGQVFAGTKNYHNKYISLIGEDRDETILYNDTYMNDDNEVIYSQTPPLSVYCDRFHAENLTLQNPGKTKYSDAGQALALYTNGDAHTFYNCRITGFQDTYKSNSGSRGYFSNCIIEGATDFIYDSGTEWFDNCTINSVAGGYVTAAGKADNTLTRVLYPLLSQQKVNLGLFFSNCTLTSNDLADGSVYLGRPWGENCGTMFLNCTLGDHINAAGWTKMGDETWESCSYAEYLDVDTSGAYVDTSNRVDWSFQTTEEEVANYFNPEFVFEKANADVSFNYTKILAGAGAPTNFVVGEEENEFTWDAEDPAPGYIVYKDGEYYQILTEPAFTVPTDGGLYTVSSISNQGVVSDAVKIRETVELIAFPTAEGFGKYASGGRGGKVVIVTNLNDDLTGSIEGSLRWAVNQYPNDPLTIVFNVSGWIILKDELTIKRGDLTIAGQTAPGEGITLYPRGLSINGVENVIIRNIRVRCGSKSSSGADLIADADKVDQALCAENAVNIIVDHCTFGWSAEEILNNQTSHFQTYSYNLLHEGLYDAGHHKGSARSYAAQWGGGQTTMHHNMIAHCNSRTPRFQGARQSAGDVTVYNEYVNNVNFNWGSWGACYGGENDQTNRYAAHQVNFCGNYYQQGPATRYAVSTSNLKFMNASVSTEVAEWYLSDNYMDGNESVTADNSKGFYTSNSALAVLGDEFLIPTKFLPNYEFDWETYTMYDKIESAEVAFANVLARVGTINRDAIEKRIIEECTTGTATYGGTWGNSLAASGIIDDPDELTGEMATDSKGFVYCIVAADSEVRADDFDSDQDGMADAWELENGLTVGVQDNNVLNDDGYTALEVYINSLMGEEMDTTFSGSNSSQGITDTLLDEQSIGSHILYNVSGQRVNSTYRGIVIKNGIKTVNK